VSDSVSQGCTKTYEGPEPISDDPRGNFFKPVVLENIPTNSRAYCEELFGPVFSLYRAKSEQEAVRIANDSDYGLGAAVFS
jgi:acyl-CoA reductase-like NAD-dependent aldehyde dehydrogenase